MLTRGQAAAKLKRVRDDIYSALEEIPDILDHANNKLEMFKEHGLQHGSRLFYWGNNLMSSVSVHKFASPYTLVEACTDSRPF